MTSPQYVVVGKEKGAWERSFATLSSESDTLQASQSEGSLGHPYGLWVPCEPKGEQSNYQQRLGCLIREDRQTNEMPQGKGGFLATIPAPLREKFTRGNPHSNLMHLLKDASLSSGEGDGAVTGQFCQESARRVLFQGVEGSQVDEAFPRCSEEHFRIKLFLHM
jgi:hypothetical protein